MDPQDSTPAVGGDGIVTSSSNIEEIIIALGVHACPNVTSYIDHKATGTFPCAGGGFCDVYRGKLRGGTSIAIKAMRVYTRPEETIDSECLKSLKRAARELYHWSKMAHGNVLPLIGPAVFRGQISMISEWMENGSLISFVRVNPNANRTKLCIDVCKGLCYIHLIGMVHGDLKAANVVVSPKGDAMITDFGNTKLKDIAMSLKFTDTTSRAHSVRWTAPELLFEADGPPVSREGDVYAYGMTVLETLTGKAPYDGFDEKRVIISVAINKQTPTRPGTGIDDELWTIMESCWIYEASKRPGITTVNSRLQGLFAHEPSQPRCVGGPGDTTNANKQGLDQMFTIHAVIPSMKPEVIETRSEAVNSPMQLQTRSISTQANAQNIGRHHKPASFRAPQTISPVGLASSSAPPTPGPSSSSVYAEPPLRPTPTEFRPREFSVSGVELIPISDVSAPDPPLGLPQAETSWLLGLPPIGADVPEHGPSSSPGTQLPVHALGRSTGLRADANVENIQDHVDHEPWSSRVHPLSVHVDAGTEDSTSVTLVIPRSALVPQHLAHGEQGDSRPVPVKFEPNITPPPRSPASESTSLEDLSNLSWNASVTEREDMSCTPTRTVPESQLQEASAWSTTATLSSTPIIRESPSPFASTLSPSAGESSPPTTESEEEDSKSGILKPDSESEEMEAVDAGAKHRERLARRRANQVVIDPSMAQEDSWPFMGFSHDMTYVLPPALSVAQLAQQAEHLGFKLQPDPTRRPELEARIAQRRQKIEELQREEEADAAVIAGMSNTWNPNMSFDMMGMPEDAPEFNPLSLGMLEQDTMGTSFAMQLLGPDSFVVYPSPSPSFHGEFSSGSHAGLPGLAAAPSPANSFSLASPPPMSFPGSIIRMEDFRTSQLMELVGKDEAGPSSTNSPGPGTHKCESCGETFRRPEGLKDHMDMHSAEKPYCCPLETCRKGFVTRSNMIRHHNMTHPNRPKIGGAADVSAGIGDGADLDLGAEGESSLASSPSSLTAIATTPASAKGEGSSQGQPRVLQQNMSKAAAIEAGVGPMRGIKERRAGRRQPTTTAKLIWRTI